MPNPLQVKVKAKVQVTLEITVASVWGSETSMNQIHKQASEEAINALNKKFAIDNDTGCKFCTLGQPKVLATTAERLPSFI